MVWGQRSCSWRFMFSPCGRGGGHQCHKYEVRTAICASSFGGKQIFLADQSRYRTNISTVAYILPIKMVQQTRGIPHIQCCSEFHIPAHATWANDVVAVHCRTRCHDVESLRNKIKGNFQRRLCWS